ncbi:baculoviral iap repeat-containing protein 7-b [Plakobranchus ocellatus]|uniref:Baculoviral iap repeat-containing protein 7-b n=1 Tax=Plakobranchus ocellatus TaxID=259542 RepID=A0AAV3YMX0_9GAST|nr:baculoviral iap repeat-containing protein 7-b [Plakobranchus ocellatus]
MTIAPSLPRPLMPGFMDKVKCYACGVSLYNWALPVDPATQHAIASSSCHFLADTWGAEFIRTAQGEQLIVDAEQEEITDEHAATSPNGFSSISTPTAAAAAATSTTPWSSPAAAASSSSPPASPASSAASPGSPVLDLEAIKAAMACQYTIEQIAHAVRKFFILSCGRYPNTGLLLGTLKAADENHIRLCEKTQEVAIKDSQLQAKDSQLQVKDSVIKAKDSEIQAKDRELQRTTFELQWRDLEVRTELEQQFVGQIQQAREVEPSARPGRRWRGSNPRQKDPCSTWADSLATVPPTLDSAESLDQIGLGQSMMLFYGVSALASYVGLD